MTIRDSAFPVPDDLVALAERMLRNSVNACVRITGAVRLTDPERRNVVLRCAVEGEAMPRTVIVKQAAPGRYDPSDLSPNSGAHGLFSDWAGAQFLQQVAPELHIAPRFVAGDRAHGVVILEDLGGDRGAGASPVVGLDEMLLGNDEAEATRGLFGLADVLGQMHATTAGRAAEYRAIRAKLDGGVSHAEEGTRARRGLAEVAGALALLDIVPPTAFVRELEAVGLMLDEPGPFATFIHGDPCPDNCLVTPGGLRLIDFERGRYGHALRDGAYGHIPFPTCWCIGTIPGAVVGDMERRYRAALSRGVPQAEEDALFDRALVGACGGWTFSTFAYLLPFATTADERWGTATFRPRLIARLHAFAALAERRRKLPAMAFVAGRLAGALQRAWPDDGEIALYPAFAG